MMKRLVLEVWKAAPLKGEPLIVLMALAAVADDDGVGHGTHAEIARRARTDVGSALCVIAGLERDGYIAQMPEDAPGIINFRFLPAAWREGER